MKTNHIETTDKGLLVINIIFGTIIAAIGLPLAYVVLVLLSCIAGGLSSVLF